MIGSLRGKLLVKRPDSVLIDVHGVGYQVHLPLNILSRLPNEGHEVFLHIYTHVREESLQLYGFLAEEEKRIFTTLLGITGIGPKMALNILSGLSLDEFLKALETEDVAMLCRIPGLGKKTAHRLILELREKLPAATGLRLLRLQQRRWPAHGRVNLTLGALFRVAGDRGSGALFSWGLGFGL